MELCIDIPLERGRHWQEEIQMKEGCPNFTSEGVEIIRMLVNLYKVFGQYKLELEQNTECSGATGEGVACNYQVQKCSRHENIDKRWKEMQHCI